MLGRSTPYADRPPLRTVLVPVLSTLAGSTMSLLPIVATEPLMPPLGLMMLLAWRLLRPEIWPAWAALPLGLADDLLSGHYLGTAMLLWTLSFLVLEWVDQLLRWRDAWIEWALATAAIILIGIADWALSQTITNITSVLTIVPQTLEAILLFPSALRVTAWLDGWRLKR